MMPSKTRTSFSDVRNRALLALSVMLLCVTASTLTAAADDHFHTIDLSPDAEHRLSVERGKPDSWFGLGSGRRTVFGVPFDVVDGGGIDEKRCVADARVTADSPGATHVFALVGHVREDSRLAVEQANGQTKKIDLARRVPGLKGWPRSVNWHADMVHASVEGLDSVEVRGLYLFALTVYTGDPEGLGDTLSAFRQELKDVRQRRRRLQAWRELRGVLEELPGSIAVLPDPKAPNPLDASQVAEPVHGAELGRYFTELAPEQLADEDYFTPERFPIAVYTAGETYYQTVKEPKDADAALRRYLSSGGILLSLSRGIYPFFYNEKGQGVGNAEEFGLPICGRGGRTVDGRRVRGWREVPDHTFTFHLNAAQDIVTSLPETLPYPEKGDRRWRPVANVVGQDNNYVPILTLKDEEGRSWGQGAVWIDYRSGALAGASLGHVWKTLLTVPKTRDVLAPALLRHAVEKVNTRN